MATISLSHGSTSLHHPDNSSVVEKIGRLIQVHKDGYVERPPIVPHATCMVPLRLYVEAIDVMINKFTNLWVRVYAPTNKHLSSKLSLIVYFHGGWFCVGSASWACYHDFLINLSWVASCVVVSVNYRLAPENRLPAAYDDGFNVIMWLKQESMKGTVNQLKWCDYTRLYLAGDSAGANITHHVASRLVSRPVLSPKGVILIQPFFGGESRTMFEKHSTQTVNSMLTLAAADTYWRLALPVGSTRDHPWCNPLAKGAPRLSGMRFFKALVCVAELDILRGRNLEFTRVIASVGAPVQSIIYKDVGHAFQVLHNYPAPVQSVIYKDVGHAFQVLHNYPMAQTRTHEMMTHVKAFINH